MSYEQKVPKKCPDCGKKLAVYIGKYGNFLGCNGYLHCNFKFNLIGDGIVCPVCNNIMKERTGKFGPFFGCSNFPNCKFAFPLRIIKEKKPMKK